MQEGIKHLFLALESDIVLADIDAATSQIANKIPGEWPGTALNRRSILCTETASSLGQRTS